MTTTVTFCYKPLPYLSETFRWVC